MKQTCTYIGIITFSLVLLLFGGQAYSQVCSNPGVDGPATPTGIINSYYPGTGTVSAGSTSITVNIAGKRGAAANIAAGDLIIIMQMQDADIDSSNTSSYGSGNPTGSGYTSLNNSGTYEYAVVSPSYVTGTSPITVTDKLFNNYRSSAATLSAGQRTFQVIRVPQYASAVVAGAITASRWGGTGTEYTGGVVAFDVAGQLSWGGQSVDVTGLGFRGAGGISLAGANPTTGLANTDFRTTAPTGTVPFAGTGLNRLNGGKGEGVAGTPRWVNNNNVLINTGAEGYPNGSFARGAPGNAGGGGTDGDVATNQNNSGGGGGGAYSPGGMGGYGWTPDTPPMYMTGGYGGESVSMIASRLTMGGGGGAGTSNNATGTPGNGFASSGAAGGGIVIIRTRTTTGTGTINANGAAGNTTVVNDASGGGGGGGAVLMFATNSTLTGITINAKGGNGGSNSPGAGVNPHGPGGGGGGGFVAISSAIPVNVNGGAYGTTNASATTTVDYGSSSSSGGYQLYALLPTDLPGAGSNALCSPLLTVTKTTGTPNTVLGGTATYTLTVTNAAGYGNATGVSLSDVLPGAPSPFTYASTSSITLSGGAARTTTTNPVVGATSPSWSSFSIPGGGSVSITFTVNVPAGTTLGTYQNPGTTTYDDPTRTANQTVTPGGTYTGGGAVPGSNYNPASSTFEDVTVRTPATFSKSFNPTSISVGGTSVLTVTIGNPSGIPLTSAAFSDNYPAGLMNAAVPAASTTCPGGVVTAAAGGTSFSLSGATIPITGCQVQVTVSSPASGPFTNTIPVWALTNAENISNAVAASATLLGRPTIVKAFSPIAVAQNTNDTLTFTVNNPNGVGLTNIAFSDTYPAGLVNATPLTTGGTCTGVTFSGTTVAGGTLLNVTAGNVPASGSCTITVLVRSATAGNYPNTTSGVTSTQTPDVGQPSGTVALGVGVIVVSKAFAPAQIASGGTSTVTLTLNNPTGVAQTNGILTDTLTNMQISANQTAGGTCGAFTGNALTTGQTSLNFSGISIPAAGCTITFIVTSSTTGSNLNTTSGVSTALLPVGPASNSATLTVVQKPSIAKAFVPASFPPGGSGSMQLTITNPDSIPLTGISFTDSYPANLVNGTPLAISGTCSGIVTTATAGGSTFNVTAGTVPALSSCTISVPVTSGVAGTYNNATSGVATTETGSAGAASNTATLNVVVPPAVTAKSFTPPLISQNGVSTMTVTLQNSNAVPLTNVNFTDALTNMTVANSSIGGSCFGTNSSPALAAGATNLNLMVPTLGAGTSCTVTIQITSSVSGANTNQTSGATSTQTPVAGSPSPVATLNVLRPPQLAKNFLPSQITVGGSSTMTFAVTNPNATTALNNVQFSDTLSNMTVASTSFSETCSGSVSFSPALTIGGTQVNPILTALAANETCTISVTVTSGTISPAAGHSNTTSGATSTETSINPGTPASASLDVLGPVTIAKAFSPATIQAGGTSTITFTLTNPNASAMTGASFTDVFPAGLTTTNVAQNYTGAGPPVRGTCTGAIPNAKATTTLDDSPNSGATPKGIIAGINIPANGSCTLMVDVTAAASGSYVNTVSGVTTAQVPTAGPIASATLTVLARPTVTKTFSPSSIESGTNATLTLTINNPNSSAIALSSLFTDSFPAGMTIAVAGNSGTCTGVTATAGAGNFTIANGTSIPSGGCTVIVTVTSSTVGTATNTIAAGALQTTAGTNAAAASDTLTVASGTLIYTKTFSKSQVQAGPAAVGLNMVFTISNLSGTNATRVRFSATDTMPTAGTQQMVLDAGTNSCSITASVPANGCISNAVTGIGATVVNALASPTTLNFQNANSGLRVNAGAVCTVTCPVTIPAATTGGTYTNTAATLTSSSGHTSPAGDTASVIALKPPTIAKAFDPAVIGAGSTSTLTFTLSNTAASTVAYSNATFTDTLTNMSIAGNQAAGGTCSGAAGNTFTDAQTGLITLTGLTIPAGGSCTVTLAITSTNVAVNANTTSGVTTTQTPTAGTGAASVNLTVRGTTLTKAFTPATVLTGVPSTLTFTVTNGTGNPAQTGLAFTETLPANVVVASPANASTTCGGGMVTAGSGSSSIVLSNGGMALAQATCTVTVDVVSNTAAAYSNPPANVTGLSPGMTYSGTPTLTVNNHPTLTKAYSLATIGLNGTSTLTFTVANSTGNPVQSGLAFTDTFPAGLTVTAVGAMTGTGCSGTRAFTASTVSLTAGAITAGNGPCTFTATVRGDSIGSYPNTNVGNITALAGGLTSNALSSTLTVVGTTLSKSFSPTTQMLGSNSQLTLTITNGAGNPAQSGLGFTDTLPAGLTYSSVPVNNCGGTVTIGGANTTLTLAGGVLALAAPSCTITVNTIATAAGIYTNNAARISGASSNIDASAVSAAVTYLSQAGISKAFSPNTITSDTPSTITFSLSNANSITLTGATFTDTLTGMAVNANQSAAGTCGGVAGNSFTAGQTGLLTFSGLSVPPGGCTVTVVVTSDIPGTYNNTTSGVTTTQTTIGAVSNTAQLTVTAASPTITKAFGPATINQGTTSTITFTLGNINGINLTAAGFSDTLANMTISGAQAAGGTCAGAGGNSFVNGQTALTFTGLTIPLNGSCTVSVTVFSNSVGTQTNQASGVSSSQAPTGPVSNTANLVVQALPTLSKAFSVGTVGTGLPATLTFTITNPAGAPARSALTFTDTFPANLVIAATPAVVNGCGGTPTITATAGAGSFTVAGTGVNAAAGASTCTVSVNVSSSVPLAGYVNGAAQITAISGMLSGVTAQTLNVYAPPTVTKSFTPASISFGGTSSMVITVTNPAANPGNLTGVSIGDTYLGTLKNNAAGGVLCSAGSSATLTGGVNAGTTVGFNAGTIAPGGTCSITQSVTATATVNNSTTAPTASGPVALTGTAAGPITLTVFAVPSLTFVKMASSPTASPGQTITYTLQTTNSGLGDATSVLLNDALSRYTFWGIDSFGVNTPFLLTQGTPASGLVLGAPAYSNDGGSTWSYVPSSGAGGAPAGFDGNVTNWRIPMIGSMPGNGAYFTLQYKVQVR